MREKNRNRNGRTIKLCFVDEVKSNTDKIKDECYKINRDLRDIHTAAILYPNVIYSDYTDIQKHGEGQQRHFLNGSIDQVGRDLQEVKKAGIDHVILNYNRSVISDNICKIIEVSKQLSRFILSYYFNLRIGQKFIYFIFEGFPSESNPNLI